MSVPSASSPSPKSISSTSTSLIARVRARDAEAWQRLASLYTPLTHYWIRAAGIPAADVDDVLQEVFIAVARSIGDFRKDRPSDTFRGWLRTIVRSKAIDHFRRAKRQPKAKGGSTAGQIKGLADPLANIDETEENALKRQLYIQGLEMIRAHFEDRTWQMFWRVTIEHHTAAEVAKEFGVSPSAVRLAKSRVLARMREELGDLGDFGK